MNVCTEDTSEQGQMREDFAQGPVAVLGGGGCFSCARYPRREPPASHQACVSGKSLLLDTRSSNSSLVVWEMNYDKVVTEVG